MHFYNSTIELSRDSRRNILEVDDRFYQIQYLNGKKGKSKGGNSCVFDLIDPNTDIVYAIKFSKFPRNSDRKNIQRNKRFQHEINALKKAKDKDFDNVIEIVFDGVQRIDAQNFTYYVMEKATADLSSYLTAATVSVEQKCVLCYDIIRGLGELHSMDLYHRDIKPDNIFFVGQKWKIGDLGLSEFRDQESIDRKNEPVGPYGWLSPEVMNKMLCEGTPMEKVLNCVIDEKSDVFQLGKLIWYIFNGNVPIGQIRDSDFNVNHAGVFRSINKMLQYNSRYRGKLITHKKAFENYIT